MADIKKYILGFIFFIISIATIAAPTSFLPMEDGLSPARRSVYGASVETVKPYRQPVALEATPQTSGYNFGSKDVLLCILLLGVYFVFTHKKSGVRNAEL